MKLTRRIRNNLSRKLRSNWTKENLLTYAYRNLIKRELLDKIKSATSEAEVEDIINSFDVDALMPVIGSLANSAFSKSAKEFDTIMSVMIKNPKDKYLNLRAKGLLHKKEDFKPFLEAFKHNLSLIGNLPKDLAKDMRGVYMRGTAFRGTAYAKELSERLGKRAKTIIRTESAKITSTLTQARMRKIGLNAYIWSTSEDSRVRSAHAVLDGVLVFWDDAPTLDNYREHCGRFVNCRCVPIPVTAVDDIQFPITVAVALTMNSNWVKGGKGKVVTKIVSGALEVFTKERFIERFGDKFD